MLQNSGFLALCFPYLRNSGYICIPKKYQRRYKSYADYRFKRLRKYRQGAQKIQEEIREGQDIAATERTPIVHQAFR
jgi:hypothetical protein